MSNTPCPVIFISFASRHSHQIYRFHTAKVSVAMVKQNVNGSTKPHDDKDTLIYFHITIFILLDVISFESKQTVVAPGVQIISIFIRFLQNKK